MKKIIHILINTFIFIITLLTIFILLEILLRVFPQIDLKINEPYRYTDQIGKKRFGIPFHSYSEIYPLCFDKRNYYKKSNGVINYNFNQFGTRWIRSEEQELRGENVFVVGDSLALGFGLRYEDTYIFKLQNLLHKDKLYLNFLNFSRPAANSNTCLDIYRERRDGIPHDILVYNLHLNDLITFPTNYIACGVPKYSMQLKKDPRPINRLTNSLCIYGIRIRDKSRLVDFIVKRIIRYKSRQEKIQELINPSRFESTYFIRNMDAIRKMDLEAEQHGAKFFVVILPILVDLQKATFEPVYDRIKNLLDTHGIKYFDLSSSVVSYYDSELWILPFDQHPNDIANEIFARDLKTMLKNVIVLENQTVDK